MRTLPFLFLLFIGCTSQKCLRIGHYSSSNVECAQTARIFSAKLADKIIDATSCEEVKMVLGRPTNEFGYGVAYSRWVFDNGEVYEINSLNKRQDNKTPVGIIFPAWHIKRKTTTLEADRRDIATVELTSEKRSNMVYRIEVMCPQNGFFSIDDKSCILFDANKFLKSGLDNIEARVYMNVRRTDCDNVYGFTFPKKIMISRINECQSDASDTQQIYFNESKGHTLKSP